MRNKLPEGATFVKELSGWVIYKYPQGNQEDEIFRFDGRTSVVDYWHDKKGVNRRQIRGNHMAFGEKHVFPEDSLMADTFICFMSGLKDDFYRSEKYWLNSVAFYRGWLEKGEPKLNKTQQAQIDRSIRYLG